MKAVQTTGEAFSPQKRKFSTSKHGIYYCFLFFWVIFALLDLDPQFRSGLGSRDPIESDSIFVANFISQSGIYELFPSYDFLEED
jgi:hypothetical protein